MTTEQGRIRLLDADPGLGEGMPPELELHARDNLVAETLTIQKGLWSPADDEPDGHLGYLVLDGILIKCADRFIGLFFHGNYTFWAIR